MADAPDTRSPDPYSDFAVDPWTHRLSGWVERHPTAMIRLGRWESALYRDRLDQRPVDRPIFICGLARAGTTLMIEFVAGVPGVATHRYRDFPCLFTPVWWNQFLDAAPFRDAPERERSHRDGIRVSPESPEAMEEVLWMAFFPTAHDPAVSNVLPAETDHAAFESFFRDHLAKVLWVRQGRRYASKGNYNVTRLGYLARLFPDARFVLPVRDPVSHVASLMKQQRLFSAAQTAHPRARAHLRRVGHFEFGLDRRPVNPGDAARTREVIRLWEQGEELRGWARYWAVIHDFVHRRLESDPALAERTLVVPFPGLCDQPAAWLQRVLDHCGLDDPNGAANAFAARVRFPAYYRPGFAANDLAILRDETEDVEQRLLSLASAPG